MTDFQLIVNKDYTTLWKKYKYLIMVFWKKLPDYCKIFYFDNSFNDFNNSCYESVVKSAKSINVDLITDKETWTFYIQLYHYLQNYTTRDIVGDYIKHFAYSELPFQTKEFSYIENPGLNLFWESLTDLEKHIVNKRLEGISWYDIYKSLKLSVKEWKATRSAIEEKLLNTI